MRNFLFCYDIIIDERNNCDLILKRTFYKFCIDTDVKVSELIHVYKLHWTTKNLLHKLQIAVRLETCMLE